MAHDTRKSCFAKGSWHNEKDIIYSSTVCFSEKDFKCEVNSIRRILAIGYRITTSSVLLNFIVPSLHVFLRSDLSNLQYWDDLKPEK